ncbi:MAG: amidohydrolase family protein, partial [Emcibacter sp.]|nr:amidohydrolase family protein [Emcibacter sp.]
LESPGFSSLDDRVKFVTSLAKQYFTSSDSLITLGISPEETVLWPNEETAITQLSLARDLSAHVFWHCNALGHEGKNARDVDTLRKMGLLGPDMVLVHMNFTDPDEWQMVADYGAAVSFTPDTELQMGMSWPSTVVARQYGITQGYGADITSNNSGDMFMPLRFALQVARCQMNEKHNGNLYDGVPITCKEALAWGTIDGAKALGLDHMVGSLTPGKQADIVMLRTNTLSMTGWDRSNAAGTVLLQASVQDVDTVMVAGNIVKRNGRLLADTKHACQLVQAATDRVAGIASDNGKFYVSPEETYERMSQTLVDSNAT